MMAGHFWSWVIFLASLIWVGIGWVLLWYFSRIRSKSGYQRSLGARVCEVGENFEVNLKVSPPPFEGEIQPKDILLCFDESGSMGCGPGSPLMEAIRAGETFVKQCPPQLQIGIVRFSSHAELAAPLNASRGNAMRAIRSLGQGGGTAIDQALNLCREAFMQGRPDTPKAIILLSDGESSSREALKAKERLLDAYPELSIICIGLQHSLYSGWGLDVDLLKALADKEDHCLVLNESQELSQLYNILSTYVSDGLAISGVIEEHIPAPHPFKIHHTGSMFPCGITEKASTFITWSAPVMELGTRDLSYALIPECPGWHKITLAPGRAVWRMPDHSVLETVGPSSQRILVLPWYVSWAWPLFNPLFFLIFGKWVRKWFCHEDLLPRPEARPVTPLPIPSLPRPLPAPEPFLTDLGTQPALVIGIGQAGAWALTHLNHIAMNRGVSEDRLHLLAVDTLHPSQWQSSTSEGDHPTQVKRVGVGCDLRPYLESLREKSPLGREWVPWQQWLADVDTLNSGSYLDDRRKARLSLLLNFENLENQIAAAIQQLETQTDEDHRGAAIYLVGAVEDPAFSGMAAEIGHLCACQGRPVSLVMARTSLRQEQEAAVAALGRELERLYLLGGETLLSDRTQPPASTKRIFDKLILDGATWSDMRSAGKACADLVWPLLAYSAFERKITAPARGGDQLFAWTVHSESHHLPMATLWQWVVAQTLTKGIVMSWLELEKSADEWRMPISEVNSNSDHTKRFWSGEAIPRVRPETLPLLQAILNAPNPLVEIFMAVEVLPAGESYSFQTAYWRAKRADFIHYCDAWAEKVLVHEQALGNWGLMALVQSLGSLQNQFTQIQSQLETYSGDSNFVQSTQLLRSQITEMTQILERMEKHVKAWIGAVVGPLVEANISAPESELWMVKTIEQRREVAERAFQQMPSALKNQAEAMYLGWWESYGSKLSQHLHFDLLRNPEGTLKLQLRVDEVILATPEMLLPEIENWLEIYRPVVMRWPLITKRETDAPVMHATHDTVAAGRLVKQLFPDSQENLDDRDPFFGALYLPRQILLKEALNFSELPSDNLPFVWPEEHRAEVLARELSHQLQEKVRFTNPRLIDLLRYPDRLQAFLADLAGECVKDEHGALVLLRNDERYIIGEGLQNQPAEVAMDNFEKATRNVVVFQTSTDGSRIPDQKIKPVETIQKPLETKSIIRPLIPSIKWREWGRVISNAWRRSWHQ